jgi:hypothetical protein
MIQPLHCGSAASRHDRDSEADWAKRDRKQEEAERKKALDEALDAGLEGTFPGSDPVAVTQPPRSPRDKNEP